MKDIQLEELPKSKEFMKHVGIADTLTKETRLEHSFRFCKPNDKIIVDKMCTGTECKTIIKTKKCNINDNGFHTHPHTEKHKSEFSSGDIHSSAHSSFYSKKPNITCVKSITDNNILCGKINIKNKIQLMEIQQLRELSEFKITYEEYEEISQLLNDIVKPKTILFDSKTGKIKKRNLQ